jgi:hypothetical protein
MAIRQTAISVEALRRSISVPPAERRGPAEVVLTLAFPPFTVGFRNTDGKRRQV